MELTTRFEKTNIDWKLMSTSSVIDVYYMNKLYFSNFYFAGAAGLGNLKSNIHTIIKEACAELLSRGIEVE